MDGGFFKYQTWHDQKPILITRSSWETLPGGEGRSLGGSGLFFLADLLCIIILLITQWVLPGPGSDLTMLNIGTSSLGSETPGSHGVQGKSYLAPSHCLIQVNSQSSNCWGFLEIFHSLDFKILTLLTLRAPSFTQSNWPNFEVEILCQLICFLLTSSVYLKMLPPNGCIIHIWTKNKSDKFLPLGKLDC